MAGGHTISGRLVARLVQYLAQSAPDSEAICAAAGVDLATVRDPDGRIATDAVYELFERAAARTGEPNVGFRVAAITTPDAYDAVGLLLLASATLRAGLERVIVYQRIWGDGERFGIEPTAQGARVRFRPTGDERPAHRHISECAIAEVVLGALIVTGGPVAPLAVRFRHAAPPSVDEHVALFGRSVAFGCPQTDVELDAATLDRPLPLANATFRRFFERQAQQSIARRPEQVTFVDRLRAEIHCAAGAGGNLVLGAMARRLGMSARTMQRRLADERSSYEEVRDTFRRDQALRYLRDGVAIAEIALLLGYADQSVFSRAFKQWTGRSPGACRGNAGF